MSRGIPSPMNGTSIRTSTTRLMRRTRMPMAVPTTATSKRVRPRRPPRAPRAVAVAVAVDAVAVVVAAAEVAVERKEASRAAK
jgi:hypothetical protein